MKIHDLPAISLQAVGTGLVIIALLSRASVLFLTATREGALGIDTSLLAQSLVFLTLLVGFAFQQIGRYQERGDSTERHRQEKEERREHEKRAAALLDAQTENIRLQNQLLHEQTIRKLEDNRQETQKVAVAAQSAYDVANHVNTKIVDQASALINLEVKLDAILTALPANVAQAIADTPPPPPDDSTLTKLLHRVTGQQPPAQIDPQSPTIKGTFEGKVDP